MAAQSISLSASIIRKTSISQSDLILRLPKTLPDELLGTLSERSDGCSYTAKSSPESVSTAKIAPTIVTSIRDVFAKTL